MPAALNGAGYKSDAHLMVNAPDILPHRTVNNQIDRRQTSDKVQVTEEPQCSWLVAVKYFEQPEHVMSFDPCIAYPKPSFPQPEIPTPDEHKELDPGPDIGQGSGHVAGKAALIMALVASHCSARDRTNIVLFDLNENKDAKKRHLGSTKPSKAPWR